MDAADDEYVKGLRAIQRDEDPTIPVPVIRLPSGRLLADVQPGPRIVVDDPQGTLHGTFERAAPFCAQFTAAVLSAQWGRPLPKPRYRFYGDPGYRPGWYFQSHGEGRPANVAAFLPCSRGN